MTWVEDPHTGIGLEIPEGWTVLDSGGAIPVVAVDRSAGPGVFAPSVVASVVAADPVGSVHRFAERNRMALLAADPFALVIAEVDGDLDGLPVRETLVSTLVGAAGVSTVSLFLIARDLGVRLDVSVESWDTESARQLARTILAKLRLPHRPPTDSLDQAATLGAILDSAFASAGSHG